MRHGRHERRAPAAKHGRYAKKRKLNKSFLVTLSILLVLGLAVGGTIAYLIVNGGQVTNTFTPGNVACSVDSYGRITNTGNVDAYIRAAVVVNWVDNDGNVYAKNVDFTIGGGNGWTQGSDGFFYYNVRVAPNATISAPVSVTVTSDNPDEGTYHHEIDIVAEAIQAEGTLDSNESVTAVLDAWHLTLGGN